MTEASSGLCRMFLSMRMFKGSSLKIWQGHSRRSQARAFWTVWRNSGQILWREVTGSKLVNTLSYWFFDWRDGGADGRSHGGCPETDGRFCCGMGYKRPENIIVAHIEDADDYDPMVSQSRAHVRKFLMKFGIISIFFMGNGGTDLYSYEKIADYQWNLGNKVLQKVMCL